MCLNTTNVFICKFDYKLIHFNIYYDKSNNTQLALVNANFLNMDQSEKT